MKSNEIIKAVMWRRAIKEFRKDRVIEDDDFDVLLEAARFSPSSLGLEPWSIILLKDRSVRQLIRPHCTGAQRQLDSASHFVVFTVKADLAPASEYFRNMKQTIQGFSDSDYQDFVVKCALFQEKKQDLTDYRKRIDWAGKQAYIALGSMMLSAALLGIDSCPIEGFVPKEVEAILHNRGLLDPKIDRVVVMAAFGYRANEPGSPQKRRPLENIVHHI